jgi:hypothetical protein
MQIHTWAAPHRTEPNMNTTKLNIKMIFLPKISENFENSGSKNKVRRGYHWNEIKT